MLMVLVRNVIVVITVELTERRWFWRDTDYNILYAVRSYFMYDTSSLHAGIYPYPDSEIDLGKVVNAIHDRYWCDLAGVFMRDSTKKDLSYQIVTVECPELEGMHEQMSRCLLQQHVSPDRYNVIPDDYKKLWQDGHNFQEWYYSIMK
jgi:hypothetical protein